QRCGERMIAEVRCVVAGATGPGDDRNAADNKTSGSLVVIQASHSGDVDGRGIEQSLAACHSGTGMVIGQVSPRVEDTEDRGVKRITGWILEGRDLGVDPDEERLADEGFGPAAGALRVQVAGTATGRLRRE